ncbi:MAG TPA: DNA-binding domain-containing protein [Verrucomicrobiae bacterium]
MKPKKRPLRKAPAAKSQSRREYLELQRLMASAVMRPLSPRDAMQSRWHDGQPMKKVAAGFIKPNDRLSSFERLEIYNRQYWFRLRDCFCDDYPGLRAALGDRRFGRLADAYLAAHPSASFSLRNLGRRLLAFLEAHPRWIEPHRALAFDMARLEWAQIEAFDNEAMPPLGMDSLLEIDPARTRLRLQPHLSLLELSYPVDEFLIQVKRAERLRDEASNAVGAHPARLRRRLKRRLKPQTVFLAVHRHNDTVYYKRLELGAFRVLSAFLSKGTIEEACLQLASLEGAPGDLGGKIKKWFESWASLGWLCRVNQK